MIIERVKGFKRSDLASKFCKLGHTRGVEVGVQRARYSKILCDRNPNLYLVGVDDYGIVEERCKRLGQRRQNRLYKEALEVMKPYHYKLLRKTSMEGAIDFPYECLDFVYIDGAHQFDYVMCDIIEWVKRVRTGGIVSGHDYFLFRCADVVDSVNTYCKKHRVKNLYITDEKEPSWWFEKTW